uniref:Ig-like domain-containing protein n=1 Tax=Rhodnius prolixus TaxID=13249 RepID=T1HZS8_RHOPR
MANWKIIIIQPELGVTKTCCLRNISLSIRPPAVERGKEATLLCEYDLEDAPLYAVKWYRGVREFYRYSPNENPPTKIFPFHGIHVDIVYLFSWKYFWFCSFENTQQSGGDVPGSAHSFYSLLDPIT